MKLILAALIATSLAGCATGGCANSPDPDACYANARAMIGLGSSMMQQQPVYQPTYTPPRNLNCRVYGNNNIQCN